MSTTKEKNGTFDKSIVISNLTLLVSAVISGAIPNAWLQIFFILCYTASVFFFLKGKEKVQPVFGGCCSCYFNRIGTLL